MPAHLEPAQPDEPADAAVHFLGEQPVELEPRRLGASAQRPTIDARAQTFPGNPGLEFPIFRSHWHPSSGKPVHNAA